VKQEHCGDSIVGELIARGRNRGEKLTVGFAISDSVSAQIDHHQRRQKQETLSVIVQAHDDSQDSTQILSPGKLTPCSEMIDTSDFRAAINEPTYQTLTSVNGRMSPPGFSPNSSYATLTPLQPLPPISTMSDKFAYGHGHGELRSSLDCPAKA
jgi:hypothetical protein